MFFVLTESSLFFFYYISRYAMYWLYYKFKASRLSQEHCAVTSLHRALFIQATQWQWYGTGELFCDVTRSDQL